MKFEYIPVLAMLVLSAVYLLIAWWQLNRLSPGRRK